MKFAIDPGHGGSDPGADGPNGLSEAPVVLSIAKLIFTALENFGQLALLTREGDYFVELSERCNIANEWAADYFLSIHCNSDGEEAVGIETLFASQAGLDLALPIQDALITRTGDRDRGVKERNDLYVLNGTQMPAVLVETGFISNPQTEAKLATNDYQFVLAAAIMEGLAKFFGIQKPLN